MEEWGGRESELPKYAFSFRYSVLFGAFSRGSNAWEETMEVKGYSCGKSAQRERAFSTRANNLRKAFVLFRVFFFVRWGLLGIRLIFFVHCSQYLRQNFIVVSCLSIFDNFLGILFIDLDFPMQSTTS